MVRAERRQNIRAGVERVVGRERRDQTSAQPSRDEPGAVFLASLQKPAQTADRSPDVVAAVRVIEPLAVVPHEVAEAIVAVRVGMEEVRETSVREL